MIKRAMLGGTLYLALMHCMTYYTNAWEYTVPALTLSASVCPWGTNLQTQQYSTLASMCVTGGNSSGLPP